MNCKKEKTWYSVITQTTKWYNILLKKNPRTTSHQQIIAQITDMILQRRNEWLYESVSIFPEQESPVLRRSTARNPRQPAPRKASKSKLEARDADDPGRRHSDAKTRAQNEEKERKREREREGTRAHIPGWLAGGSLRLSQYIVSRQ